MRYLQHDNGDPGELRNAQVLGDDSPLEFDDEGRAGPLEDERAEKVAAMHRHVSLGKRAREGDTEEDVEEAAVDGDDEPNTCQTEKNDGEVCGRDLPCPYHSED